MRDFAGATSISSAQWRGEAGADGEGDEYDEDGTGHVMGGPATEGSLEDTAREIITRIGQSSEFQRECLGH